MTNANIKFQDTGNIDAFGRLRVSNPTTLFDSKQLYDNAPLFWDDSEVSGSGTSSTHSVNKASSVLSVSATTAGRRLRQTFQRFNYQPGKSQLVFMTGTLGTGDDGITKCFGLYDDDNGIFLKQEGSVISFVLRSKTSSSVVDNVQNQEDWNNNRLNGTKPTQPILDPTKSQILVIDFEWLAVGRVRIGFVMDGAIIYCHEFNHANKLAGAYMSTPNLPLRYEIENDGTGGASELEHICSSVISEGGTDDLGVIRYKSTNNTATTATTAGVMYAIMGIRLKSTHVSAAVKILSTAIQIQTASSKIEWKLLFNPTVAGTFTYSNETNSAIQTAVGTSANTVTGGDAFAGGYLESGNNSVGGGRSGAKDLNSARRLGGAIDGTLDEIVLVAMPVNGSSNVDVEGSITWQEIS